MIDAGGNVDTVQSIENIVGSYLDDNLGALLLIIGSMAKVVMIRYMGLLGMTRLMGA